MLRYLFLIITVMSFFVSCQNEAEIKIDDAQITKFSSDTGEVARITQEIIKDSKNHKLYVKRAKALLEKNQINDAISDLEIALLLDSTNTEYLNLISDYWILNGNSKPTKEYLDKSLKINPDNPETLVRVSKLYLYVQDYMKSFEYANKAIKNDPSLDSPYFVKGLCYYEMGDSLKAIRELQKAVSLNSDFYDAYQLLGVVCTKAKDTLAISYFKNAQTLNPKSIEAFYSLAYYYQETGEYNKAINEYEHIINSIDSTYSKAYYNIGYINLVYLDDNEKAISFFNLAKKYDPQNPDIYYNIGYAKENMEQIIEAKKYYEAALNIDDKHELSINGLNRL